ncbi:MAG: ATP-grasp domain-containing protein, partial [Hyphomicrobiales bacterium]|nr:ATP-grasp domain-containing protein [Hyphomicrobiales bacterium]
SPAAESYLVGEKIIAAAKETGAEAIHPGYGFLSENPGFAEAVDAAGLVFIGPPVKAIRAMGLKDAAKRLMEEAGVPVVPGYHGDNQDSDFLAGEAKRIGYPVLIKARAGGGGKGMRLVASPEDFAEALKSAQREAQASFSDPACLIEKYIEKPRHIEIQILGDRYGSIIHLFERDCSLQRRHQKVIEEAPAPGMTDEMRSAMAIAAVDAARAIGYAGAGTVEFIVDGSGALDPERFYFMEMNTRLQVEHPVTEAITGVDLVELQLRVAAGEPLPFSQDDLAINGHAFEARIYAEDPHHEFLPATGTLKHLSFPAGARFQNAGIRIDAGVQQGDEISPWYDPMIAKLIVHGEDRGEALQKLSRALGDCRVSGTTTNTAFLGSLARNGGFAAGEVDTGLIARDIAALTEYNPPTEDIVSLAALRQTGFLQPVDRSGIGRSLRGWRHWGPAEIFSTLQIDGTLIERRIFSLAANRYRVEGGDKPCLIEIAKIDGNTIGYMIDGVRKDAVVTGDAADITIFAHGHSYGFHIPDPLEGTHETDIAGDAITAPMPGLVKVISALAGQNVSKGAALIVLEAMKMEHTLKAPRDGRIAKLHTAEGEQITGGAVLVTLESETADG